MFYCCLPFNNINKKKSKIRFVLIFSLTASCFDFLNCFENILFNQWNGILNADLFNSVAFSFDLYKDIWIYMDILFIIQLN